MPAGGSPMPSGIRTWRDRRGSGRRPRATFEGLEPRQLLDAAPPVADIALLAAGTPDSRQVVVEYEVRGADVGQPFELAVYRSADDRLDTGDSLVATYLVDGPGSAGEGAHRAAIPVPDGLGIDPRHPFVLVAADPGGVVPQADRGNDVAAFRKHSVVIVTHGGLQSTPGDRVPAWVNRMSADLEAQGYDVVFPFNWVGVSRSPGSAAKQGPRLAKQVRDLVAQFPANEPVDLHFIGHSEGAVVNTLAIQKLEDDPPPQVVAGFLRHTMLDPHAANNGFPRKQYSVKDSFMGDVARNLINRFQSSAKDPFAAVPAIVDDAEVFYQHTYFAQAKGTSRDSQWFNLWGQVPVKGPGTARYTDLTGPGISHSGDFAVVDWYQVNVVPTLGDGHPYRPTTLVTGALDPRDGTTRLQSADGRRPTTPEKPVPLEFTTDLRRPRFVGEALPGSEITLVGMDLRTGRRIDFGRTHSGPDGTWRLTAPALVDGRYRLTLRGSVPASPVLPRVRSTPRFTLGTLHVESDRPHAHDHDQDHDH